MKKTDSAVRLVATGLDQHNKNLVPNKKIVKNQSQSELNIMKKDKGGDVHSSTFASKGTSKDNVQSKSGKRQHQSQHKGNPASEDANIRTDSQVTVTNLSGATPDMKE